MTTSCSRQHEDRGDDPVAAQAARAALLTPPGRGGLSVVGIGGPEATALVARLFAPRGRTPLAERPTPAIVFGTWRATVDGPGEDVVVVRRADDALEVHCHGGLAAAESVLGSLERHGGLRQPWADWLRAGGMPEINLEAHESLAAAGGPKAARILARQLAGRLEAELGRVRSLQCEGHGADACGLIDRLLRAARVGLRLTRPWRVVVAGPTNAGKSSLVNAIAGHSRSIVSPEAGTTRDLLETRIVLDGWEVDLVDTAGLRPVGEHAGQVERAGMARAIAACSAADLVLQVRDGTVTAEPNTSATPHELPVFSKADLVAAPAAAGGDALWTSVVTGRGVEELVARIVRRLVPEEADDPSLLAGAVPFTPRQVHMLEQLRGSVGPADAAAKADRAAAAE
jgi:tRNA modification GTPase